LGEERIFSTVGIWQKKTLRSLLVPGGLLLLASAALLRGGFIPISGPAVDFSYYTICSGAVLVAWRFHSSRNLFALLSIVLANRAVEFFSSGRRGQSGPGHIALEAVAFLLPLNFIVISFLKERGFTFPAITARAALLFFESVYVAVICRPGQSAGPDFLRWRLLGGTALLGSKLPHLGLLTFAIALLLLFIQFVQRPQVLGSGLLWALGAAFLGLQAGGTGKTASAYVAVAGLILVASIIENSYVLAYHDELTGLASRRAYSEALLRLEEPYAVAVVDIDHFKAFNDNYGHDTGDQVLRLVATKLEQVSGGGQAFRVGGEEFSILFRGKRAKEAAEHLELLRSTIEASRFRVRQGEERRQSTPRAPDRRVSPRKSAPARKSHGVPVKGDLSVTVSIGVAEPNAKLRDVRGVIEAADKALYRAKRAGRNRVETALASRARPSEAGRVTA
jgi:diguanylate cyclase (GGDEF)-like protein